MCDIKNLSNNLWNHLRRFWKTYLTVFIAVILLSAPVAKVYAAWDGSGSAGGSGGTEDVDVTGFTIEHQGIQDAMGYRFSVYNGDGCSRCI